MNHAARHHRRRRTSPAPVELLEPRRLLTAYVVATTGSDSNPGTPDAPWRTLQHAADTVAAGDTVTVRAGNYAGFHLTTDGADDARITFTGEAGATVNANNPVTIDGINLEGADHVTIEGFTVTGTGRAGIRSVTNHHVTIRNNVCDLNARWGILTGFSDDLLIENNVASRSQVEHGIYVGNSGDRPTIRGNHVWGNRANGIHMNGDASLGGDGVISGAVVERNVIHGNGAGGGSGINCDGVRDSRIQNNLLYDNHASGISLYRIDGGDGSKNNVVANNTVVVAADGRWALNIQDGSTGNTVLNNVLYNLGSYRGSVAISTDSLNGFVSDHNAVMDRFTTDGGASRLTLAQWRTNTGQDQHSVVITDLAAVFANVAAGDYRLKAGSPVVDAGVAVLNGKAAPLTDADRNARPAGAAHDVGAFELGSVPAPGGGGDPAPVTPALEPDPWNPGRSALVIRGTAAGETILVRKDRKLLTIEVDGVARGQFGPRDFARVVVHAGGGDDRVEMLAPRNTPVYFAGEAGNDTLVGGKGHDVLLGGDGADVLAGNKGKDLLLGGTGADAIDGGATGDVLIANPTPHDADDDAVRSIWALLVTGRWTDLPAAVGTVPADGEVDTLTGAGGRDWLFADVGVDALPDKADNEHPLG